MSLVKRSLIEWLAIALLLFTNSFALAVTKCICSPSQNVEISAITGSQSCLTQNTKPGDVFWIHCSLSPAIDYKRGAVLDLGRIADDDVTYFNDKLIGRSKVRPALSTWNYFWPRKYFIPPNLIRVDNTLSIQVHSVTGGISGLIDKAPSFADSFEMVYPKPIEIAPSLFLLFVVGVFALLKTSTAKAAKLKIYFIQGGVLTSALLFFNSFYLYRVFPNMANVTFRFHIFVTVVTVFILFRFSELLMNYRKSPSMRVITLLSIFLLIILPGVSPSMDNTRRLGLVFAAWGVPVMAYGGWLFWRALNELYRGTNTIVWPYIMACSSLIIFGGKDLASLYSGRLPVSIPLSGIAFFISFFMAAVSFILLDRQLVQQKLETDIRSLQRQHNDLAIEAEVGRVVRQVAHDIRSPLSALNLLRKSDAIDTDRQALITNAISRINEIANDLLEGSRSEKRFLILAKLNEIISEKRAMVGDKNIIITLHCDANAASIELLGSHTEFARMISNLLDNSIQAMKTDGRIYIHAKYTDELTLILSDTGPGVPHSVLKTLGTKGATYGKTDGKGLGLFSSIQTVERFGGHLDIESQGPSRGFQVRISIPKHSLLLPEPP